MTSLEQLTLGMTPLKLKLKLISDIPRTAKLGMTPLRFRNQGNTHLIFRNPINRGMIHLIFRNPINRGMTHLIFRNPIYRGTKF
jgi:ribosomal protein L30/L7E